MVFSHEVPVQLPGTVIHLDEWLFNLSEQDYQQCAKGHRGIGSSRGGTFLGMINVESIGGNLLVQHYRTELLEPLHVRLYSAKSRAYLMHLLPCSIEVRWEMEATPVSGDTTSFRCTIEVRMPLWASVLSRLTAANHWIRRHLIEETHGFARDLEKKGGK